MAHKMTRKQITEALEDAGCYVTEKAKDGFQGLKENRKAGTWTWRRDFFYTMGETSQGFANRISEIEGFTVVSFRTVRQSWPKNSGF